MAPAPMAAVLVSAAALVLAALRLAVAGQRGALPAVTLGVAAMPAAAAVAPAVALAVTERLAARGFAPDGRLCGLAGSKQALQPSEETSWGRLGRRGGVLGRHAGVAPLGLVILRPLVELRALFALWLVATGFAPVMTRHVGPVLPAIRAECRPVVGPIVGSAVGPIIGPAVGPRMAGTVAE